MSAAAWATRSAARSPALRTRGAGGGTVLPGMFADLAALSGVLARLGALGLELIGVRRLPPG